MYIGTKYEFSCINFCKVPREILKNKGQAWYFSTSFKGPGECNALNNNAWSLLLHKFNDIFTEIYEEYMALYFVAISLCSSLTRVTELCPWARHINLSLVLVQPRKTCPYKTERMLMGHKESKSKQTNRWLDIFNNFWVPRWILI